MKRFKIYTLIDITETKQYRKEPGKEQQREQQQNFQLILQTIGLRVNPSYYYPPQIHYKDIIHLPLGTRYTGKQRLWTFEFEIEYQGGLCDNNGNECGLFLEDIHCVPFISHLTETAIFPICAFDTKSEEYRNIIVKPK